MEGGESGSASHVAATRGQNAGNPLATSSEYKGPSRVRHAGSPLVLDKGPPVGTQLLEEGKRLFADVLGSEGSRIARSRSIEQEAVAQAAQGVWNVLEREIGMSVGGTSCERTCEQVRA